LPSNFEKSANMKRRKNFSNEIWVVKNAEFNVDLEFVERVAKK
jgi:hypothetical protein